MTRTTNPQYEADPNETPLFEAFPAPRVWHLGWQGDAWSGPTHPATTDDHTSEQTASTYPAKRVRK